MMKLMYLTDQVFLHGGVEKVLSLKVNWLAENSEHEILVVTTRQQGLPPVYHFSSKIRLVDLDIPYEIQKSYFNPKNIKKLPHHYRALKAIIGKTKPDIIISCNYAPDFYFLPHLAKTIPTVKEFHSSRYGTKSVAWKGKLLEWLNRRCEKNYSVLALLNADEKAFYPVKNAVVIPNPAEDNPSRASLKSKKVIAAGRISPVKNFGELIEIWKLIAEAAPEWELHFYGEDYLGTKALLEEKVNAYGLEPVIKFKGVTSDMKTTLQDYSIYAMTSHSECFPMILLEAISGGIPVVTYDAPTGPRHIVRDGEDSCLIPWGNRERFAEKMLHMMEDETLRNQMGEKAYENSRRFSVDIVMKKWENLFIYLKNLSIN